MHPYFLEFIQLYQKEIKYLTLFSSAMDLHGL